LYTAAAYGPFGRNGRAVRVLIGPAVRL
jgi:hypothetical protein